METGNLRPYLNASMKLMFGSEQGLMLQRSLHTLEQRVRDAIPTTVKVPAGSHIVHGHKEPIWTHFPEFHLAETPATKAQFRSLAMACGMTIGSYQSLQVFSLKPVTHIAPRTVLEYGLWLSVLTGKTYRLPDDEEWERAARGQPVSLRESCNGHDIGTFLDNVWEQNFEFVFIPKREKENTSDRRILTDKKEVLKNLRNGDCMAYLKNGCHGGLLTETSANWKSKFLLPGRMYQPNNLGLYDMTGNVWEMVTAFDGDITSCGGSYRTCERDQMNVTARHAVGFYGDEETGFRLLQETSALDYQTTLEQLEKQKN